MTDALSLETLDEATRRQVLAGDVVVVAVDVPGKTSPQLVVHARVDAPPSAVWALVDNTEDYPSFMPRVKTAREESREEGPEGVVVRSRITIDMPFPVKNLTAQTEARHTVVEGQRYVREWRLIEGDYKENTGAWTLVPLGDDPAKTLVRYEIMVVPKVSIPKKLQGLVQGRAMPKLIESLRTRTRGAR